ncbi:MAG: hypothetical protein HFJ38_00640 [Bacilli bacterium]|nr:hypothetical protein [Bacilli bacterium]
MNLKFVLNEYILIWNLLFKKSLSKELNQCKQKIWLNYQKEYDALSDEEIHILEDPKNYIPDDDTIYNRVREEDIYFDLYKFTEKYKKDMSQIFDIYLKKIIKEFTNIVKLSFDYDVLLVDPRLNLVDYIENEENNIICYGKGRASIDTIIDIIYNIVKKEVLYRLDDQIKNENVVDAVIDLAIHNELKRRVTDNDYLLDTSEGKLKPKIYPYFLDYLKGNQGEYHFDQMDFFDFIKFCDRKLDLYVSNHYSYASYSNANNQIEELI